MCFCPLSILSENTTWTIPDFPCIVEYNLFERNAITDYIQDKIRVITKQLDLLLAVDLKTARNINVGVKRRI